MLNEFWNEGYRNLSGIDVRSYAIEEGREAYPHLADRIELYAGEILPYEDNSFDAITMFDVIEHIPHIEPFMMDQVGRVLKPGGIFIFQTPNKYINIPWEMVNTRSLTAWKEYHCSLQTYSSLKRLLSDAGLDQIKIEKYDILTNHNKNKVRNKIGAPAVGLLYILNALPLRMFPNFWGTAVKKA